MGVGKALTVAATPASTVEPISGVGVGGNAVAIATRTVPPKS